MSEDLTLGLLAMAVELGRRASAIPAGEYADPKPGDLVVECTARRTDPDAIGWLVGHDLAPYGADDPTDGSVPMREVWDVRPLNPAAVVREIGGQKVQRWENATFRRVPADARAALGRWAGETSGETP